MHVVSDVMPINRFQQLFGCLPHLADNCSQISHGLSEHDLLFKIRKLLALVVQRFDSEYVIHQDCTIDEAMIPFKS